MKYIRKLLNPLVPFLVLLLIFAKMNYDHFSRLEDFTEEETKLLTANIDELREIQKKSAYDWKYYKYYPRKQGNDCSFDSLAKINKEKINTLKKSYEHYYNSLYGSQYIMTNNLLFGEPQYRLNGEVIALFRNYISEIQQVDSVLIPIFEDYKFNNGISKTELQRLYVSKNKKELEYIISLFATEMTLIHNKAIEEFMYQKVFLSESKFLRKNTQIVPVLNTDSSFLQVETPLFLALDTTKTIIRKQQKPHQIAHHFSKNSCFLVAEGKRAIHNIINDKFYMTVRTLKTTENCDTTFVRNY